MSPRAALRDTWNSRWARRVSRLLGLLLALVAVLSLVVLSPLAVATINPDGSADWQRLADVTQTYAAVSAVLALLALAGVAFSLLFQARELRASREQTLRVLHTDLIRMAMEDPLYMRCWGHRPSMTDDQRRQFMYINLMVSLWEMTYETSGMNDQQAHAVTASLFETEEGRWFWQNSRTMRKRVATDRRLRRFYGILDEEYQRATPPSPTPAPAASGPEPDRPATPRGPEPPPSEHTDSGVKSPGQDT